MITKTKETSTETTTSKPMSYSYDRARAIADAVLKNAPTNNSSDNQVNIDNPFCKHASNLYAVVAIANTESGEDFDHASNASSVLRWLANHGYDGAVSYFETLDVNHPAYIPGKIFVSLGETMGRTIFVNLMMMLYQMGSQPNDNTAVQTEANTEKPDDRYAIALSTDLTDGFVFADDASKLATMPIGLTANGKYCSFHSGPRHNFLYFADNLDDKRSIVLSAISNAVANGSSFVVADSSAQIVDQGKQLSGENGIKTLVFDLKHIKNSSAFNLLSLMEDDSDVDLLATLIMNGGVPCEKKDFWYGSESALLKAVISYVAFDDAIIKEERTLLKVFDLLITGTPTKLNAIFKSLDVQSRAYNDARVFMNMGTKAQHSIWAALVIKLSKFSLPVIQQLSIVGTDSINFASDEAIGVYILLNDSDESIRTIGNILVNLLYQKSLCRNALSDKRDREMNFVLDDAVKVGTIPSFESIIASGAAAGTHTVLIVDKLGQLKKTYPDDWKTIFNDFDAAIYMSVCDKETANYFSRSCGKISITEQTAFGEKTKLKSIVPADYLHSKPEDKIVIQTCYQKATFLKRLF